MANNPQVERKSSLEPMAWSCLLYIIALILLFIYFPKEQQFITDVISEGGALPEYSLAPILIYFFSVVIVMGIILFLIPISKLRLFLRILFGFFYGWGVFIILYLILPVHLAVYLSAFLAVAAGLVWFFFPIIWLQNILLLVTLVGIGATFGALISPFTVIYLLLAIAIYDIVAVRFGYMMWMARKLSETDTLPAFILPKKSSDWRLNLRGSSVKRIFEEETSERDFSLLGGGDMGFPLVFVVSVFFASGFRDAVIVAGGTLAGVIFAYLLQIYWLKGKPLPAIPPISFMAIMAFLIAHYLL